MLLSYYTCPLRRPFKYRPWVTLILELGGATVVSLSESYQYNRYRIHPVLMEALQTLKFSLKKERFNFTGGWQTAPSEMKRTGNAGTTKDLLAHLLTEDRRCRASSSGESSRVYIRFSHFDFQRCSHERLMEVTAGSCSCAPPGRVALALGLPAASSSPA
jgi:hypothetical protein